MDKRPLSPENKPGIVCKRVRFSGRVQGVGFRYTVRHLSEGFAVAGYVKNLSDGSVELVVEGRPTEVTGLVAAVKQRMSGYIEDCLETDEEVNGHQDFTIRF